MQVIHAAGASHAKAVTSKTRCSHPPPSVLIRPSGMHTTVQGTASKVITCSDAPAPAPSFLFSLFFFFSAFAFALLCMTRAIAATVARLDNLVIKPEGYAGGGPRSGIFRIFLSRLYTAPEAMALRSCIALTIILTRDLCSDDDLFTPQEVGMSEPRTTEKMVSFHRHTWLNDVGSHKLLCMKHCQRRRCRCPTLDMPHTPDRCHCLAGNT
ncbi:hypothetical protein GGR50DRAFT_589930 [Xylaria sp. CBS 124048]|nr:hypothetical protein GGR50DRAFT_589930 [Xylaria sp. CBS 124048]